ncbi:hypothetical protein KJ870_03675 [bacterium]|jgi:hypothetical protein|nr:hypothetical protein [bacterium]MBU1434021.1 hypothetical protein [bacterium]MBU1503003.1 hypothetical protein [bacterium]
MSTAEKIKRIILVALGFAFSTYLIMSGVAILNQDDINATKSEETK